MTKQIKFESCNRCPYCEPVPNGGWIKPSLAECKYGAGFTFKYDYNDNNTKFIHPDCQLNDDMQQALRDKIDSLIDCHAEYQSLVNAFPGGAPNDSAHLMLLKEVMGIIEELEK
jgi:hypothetical protein